MLYGQINNKSVCYLTPLFLGKAPRLFTTTKCKFIHLLLTNGLLESAESGDGRRNAFMTNSPQKNVLNMGVKLVVICMPTKYAPGTTIILS